jgi:hypothetical protein
MEASTELFEMPRSEARSRRRSTAPSRQLALSPVFSDRGLESLHPGESGVGVALTLNPDSGILAVDFKVLTSGSRQVLPSLKDPESNWGLWDGDVVEVFLQLGQSGGTSGPYYEFQLSPLGQRFQLKVIRPRTEIDRDFRCSGLETRVASEKAGDGPWQARFEIPLRALGWDGKLTSIRGGLFAILGEPADRTYWAAFLPPQDRPDFHLPAEFRAFFADS